MIRTHGQDISQRGATPSCRSISRSSEGVAGRDDGGRHALYSLADMSPGLGHSGGMLAKSEESGGRIKKPHAATKPHGATEPTELGGDGMRPFLIGGSSLDDKRQPVNHDSLHVRKGVLADDDFVLHPLPTIPPVG